MKHNRLLEVAINKTKKKSDALKEFLKSNKIKQVENDSGLLLLDEPESSSLKQTTKQALAIKEESEEVGRNQEDAQTNA